MKNKGNSNCCRHCGEDISNVLWIDVVKCGDGIFIIEELVNYYPEIGEYDLFPIYQRAAHMCSVDRSSIFLLTQETYAFEAEDMDKFSLPHDTITSINEFGPVCNNCGLPLS